MNRPPNQNPVITRELMLKANAPHQPVSFNMIVKGNPEAVLRCVDSVYAALFVKGTADEMVIVDTGSSNTDWKAIKGLEKVFPNCRVIRRKDLSVDYGPLCKKYLDDDLYAQYEKYIGNGKGLLSFADARNVALEASKNDLIFWIDSDDVLAEETQGDLRLAVNYVFGTTPMQQIFLDYDYEFGEDGVCTTTLRRERVFRKSQFHWKGNCHETAIPRPDHTMGPVCFLECVRSKIVHTDDRKPHNISDIRNYLILRDEFERDRAAGTLDPRTIFYIGNSARGLERFAEARAYYDMFDFRSGSLDDRYAAIYYKGQMFMDPRLKRPFDALDCYFKCVELKPNDPRGYFGLARVYGALHRYQPAVHWYEIGRAMKLPKDQVFSHDPTQIQYHPHVVAAHCYKEVGQGELALQCMERAYAFRPDNPEAKRLMGYFQNNLAGDEIYRAVSAITRSTRYPQGMDAKRVAYQICDELMAVPPRLEKAGIGKIEPPEGREEKPDINFYCGGSGEDWGPFNRKIGTGGSEKMVIMLGEALQATGLVNVNVYGEVPSNFRGVSEETGVNWRHWSEFDVKRRRDTMVFWRSPESAVSVMCPARKRVIWNHDVQDPSRYTLDVLEMADLVQFQSNFHTVPILDAIPEEKIWVARNAIEPVKEGQKLPERNAKQVLYCSSPDRGLLTACEVVKRAKKIDPEISLVVTYGVTPWARKVFAQGSHRYIPDLGRDVSMDEYERKIHATLDELGAVSLNRVGFEEMKGLQLQSGVWLYPTRFPEISCMSAMEAQANGMVVLATRYGALAETIGQSAFPHLPGLPENGAVSDEWYDAAAEMLVQAVNVPAKSEMRSSQMRLNSARFDVRSLAQDWINKLGLADGKAVPEPAQEEFVPPAES